MRPTPPYWLKLRSSLVVEVPSVSLELLIDGAIDGGAGGNLQAVETLVDAEGAAERRIDRILRKPGLDVRAAGIVGGDAQPRLRGQPGVVADVEPAVDMAGEIRAVEIGRRRRDGAVGRRRKGVAIAGERSAQVGDQGMALPVGDGEEFRRDDIERRALRHRRAAGIGVVAARELDRGFDQEAAGIIADRAERIVVDLQPLARRLADHGAGHRRRDRRLVGGLRRRDRKADPPLADATGGGGLPGPGGGFGRAWAG